MNVREDGNFQTVTYAAPDLQQQTAPLCQRVLKLADRHRLILFVAVLGLFVLGFNGQWRMERDSALYLSLARNLADGQGYTYQDQHHHLVLAGLPVLFAGVFKMFGTGSLLPHLVLMWCFGLTALALNYRLFLLHSGRPTAVILTVGLGLTRLFYRYGFELLTDMPFLVGVMAFLCGWEAVVYGRQSKLNEISSSEAHEDADGGARGGRKARWYDWGLLVGGLGVAMSMRPTMWALLATVVLALLWAAVKQRFGRVHIVVLVAIVALALVFLAKDLRHTASASIGQSEDYFLEMKFGKPLQMLHETFVHNIPDFFEAAGAKTLFGCPIGPGLNTLAGLLVIGLAIWLLRERVLWGIWALMTIGMLFLFKSLDRYCLPIVPLLVFAWWRLLTTLNLRIGRKWGDLIFLALLIFGCATNLARLGEMVVEQRRVPFLAHYRDGKYDSARRVAWLVEEQTGPHDWIVTEPNVARIMTFLAGRNAVELQRNPQLDPARHRVWALRGPSWEEGRILAQPTDVVAGWVARRGWKLGPQAGAPVEGPCDRQPWGLFPVLPSRQH